MGGKECGIREQKRKTWAVLKKWTKTRKEEDILKLRKERRLRRKIRKEKKEEDRESKRRKLEGSKNITEFWDVIRGFGAKRKGKGVE